MKHTNGNHLLKLRQLGELSLVNKNTSYGVNFCQIFQKSGNSSSCTGHNYYPDSSLTVYAFVSVILNEMSLLCFKATSAKQKKQKNKMAAARAGKHRATLAAVVITTTSRRPKKISFEKRTLLTLETSAFYIFHGGNSTFINSFDKTKFLFNSNISRKLDLIFLVQ